VGNIIGKIEGGEKGIFIVPSPNATVEQLSADMDWEYLVVDKDFGDELNVAEVTTWYYDHGYTHVIIVDPRKDAEDVDLSEMFTEGVYRVMREADVNAAANQTAPPAPATTPAPSKSVDIILLKANPPVKGFGEMLKFAFENSGDIPVKIVLHQTGIQGHVIPAQSRKSLLIGGNGPALYGPQGVSPTKVDSPLLKSDAFVLIEGSDLLKGLQQKLGSFNVRKVLAPAQFIPALNKVFSGMPIQLEPIPGTDVDTENGSHQDLLEIASNIAKASVVKTTQNPKDAVKVEKQVDPVLSSSDAVAMFLIKIFYAAVENKTLGANNTQDLWSMISEQDKALLKQVGSDTGIGDGIDVVKNIAGTVKGATNNVSGKSKTEKVDPKAIEAQKKLVESLGFDVVAAKSHKDFALFKSSLELPTD
jgi:hypothetical protein